MIYDCLRTGRSDALARLTASVLTRTNRAVGRFFDFEFFEPAVRRASQAVQHLKPFDVSLKKVGFFQHGKRNTTFFLEPQSEPTATAEASGLIALHRALLSAFPSCDDTATISASGFTPHLSVAQSNGPLQLADVERAWQSETASFLVDKLYLLHRADHADPFHVRFLIPLSSATVDVVDWKYSADSKCGFETQRPPTPAASSTKPRLSAPVEQSDRTSEAPPQPPVLPKPNSRKRIVHPWQ